MTRRRVLVVGGGSAGWIAAAYLHGALNDQGRAKNIDITLVESPDVPRISVGEATIPAILHILAVVGVDEYDFMRAVDASFKQGIKYFNWVKQDGSHYYHPFSRPPLGPIDRSGEIWAKSDRRVPYMDTVSAQPALCELNLSPKMFGQWDLGPPLYYAYHMNAQKFADYLRDVSVPRGVTHIWDNVTSVERAENGWIRAVNTQKGDRLEADLFIDSTGFQARLMGKELDVPYHDASQFLLCDRAVAMHIPYETAYPGFVRPYTTATALSAGWMWDIPMRTRRSIGYVHASRFISLEDAEAEMRRYEGDYAKDCPSRVVNFRVGWRTKAWAGNCVAVGLAGGFIEPLESTGLYLSDLAAVMLAEHFPYHDDHMPALSFRFNRIMSNRYYEILDFINLHYCLTRRDDTELWRTVRQPEHITDRLKAKLEFWKMKYPSKGDFEDQHFLGQPLTPMAGDGGQDLRPPVDTAKLWSHFSYECIMYGMHWDGRFPADGAGYPPAAIPPRISQRARALSAKLPKHEVWLKQVLGMEDYPAGPSPSGWKL
ncbi:MAG: tryptophan halogenase family protein [Parvularculaceae bacterium]